MPPRPLIAGNWKMNGLFDDGRDRVAQLSRHLEMQPSWPTDMLVCPPATLVMALGDVTEDSPLEIGGQDCHAEESGAFTGDVSAAMLRDAGCSYVIVGHSERRQGHGESDADVRAKAAAAQAAGLTAIICLGEEETQRDAGEALDVVERQLMGSLPIQATAASTVIAYEPVWAIGTGRAASLDDIAEMHDFIRGWLAERMPDGASVRLLYGGSVKPGNAADILALDAVDGALVGGASLSADDFWSIFLAATGPVGKGGQSGETR